MALQFARNRNPKGLDPLQLGAAQANRGSFLNAIGQQMRPAQDETNQAMQMRAQGMMTAEEAGKRFNTHNPVAVNDPFSALRAAGVNVAGGFGVGATAVLPQNTRINATTRQGWWGTGGSDGVRGGVAPVQQGGFVGNFLGNMSNYAGSRGPANFYDIIDQGYIGPTGELRSGQWNGPGGGQPTEAQQLQQAIAGGRRGAPVGSNSGGGYQSSLYGQMVGGGYGGTGGVAGRLDQLQQQAFADNQARYQQALQDQQEGGAALMQLAQGGFNAAGQRLDRDTAAAQGQANVRMAARGLGNSTAAEGVMRGVAQDAGLARAQIQDNLTRQQLGVGQNNLNTRLRLLEAPQTQYPDAGLYARLLAQPGAAAGAGGGRMTRGGGGQGFQEAQPMVQQGAQQQQMPQQGFNRGPAGGGQIDARMQQMQQNKLQQFESGGRIERQGNVTLLHRPEGVYYWDKGSQGWIRQLSTLPDLPDQEDQRD